MDGTDSTGRDWTRVFLIVACIVAAVAAGMLVPGLGADGLAGTPIDDALPGDAFPNGDGGGGDGGGDGNGLGDYGSDGSGLGALNPGDSTGVGGEVGFDNETFGSNDTEVHFRVESSQPAYWRTGAYDTYTGSGWERDTETRPYDAPIEHDGLTDERIDYEVTLERPASSVPTAWRPTSVSGLDELVVTDSGAVRATETLEPGTTFSGQSHAPARDPDMLRAADEDYPAHIEQRYTQLPAETPDRVGDFTAELTADDDNSYDAAMSVQQWLRTDKSYSLQVDEEGDQIADTFIFEMDEGYCEYFATAMVTMLRSQDIPARYVVGYSTGQPVGDNTYEVRGMNAHAWVEVYFEGVGWVKFDPTPGSDRLDAQQEALGEEGEEYDPEEEGSPGEQFEPGEIEQDEQLEEEFEDEPEDEPDEEESEEESDETDDEEESDEQEDEEESDEEESDEEESDEDESDEEGDESEEDEEGEQDESDEESENGDEPAPSYDIALDGQIVPGATVEVTVTRDGEPAPAREVLFNGESIGTTDSAGTVEGTVPYEDELRVSVREGDDGATTFGSSTHAGGDLFFRGELSADALTAGGLLHSDTEETYPVETNASVSVVGDTYAGEEVTVDATVEGVAVRGADVTLDGEVVAETDDDGRATVTLPEESGSVTVGVERDPVAGETTVEIPELAIDVDAGTLALPYGTATVEVTAGNASAADVPVYVDGEEVARTGPGGTATIRLPPGTEATVAAQHQGLHAETTVSGMLWNLLGIVAVVGLVIGVTLLGARRRGYTPRDVLAIARRIPHRLVQYTQWVLITVATRGDEWVRRALVRLRLTVAHLVAAVRGNISPAELWAALQAWFATKQLAASRALGRTPANQGNGGDDTTVSDAQISVREAWIRFLQCLSVPQHRAVTSTPGELATHAIEHDGLPREPVVVLRDVFREVEYGSRSAADRLRRVEEAIEAIERARTNQRTEEGSTHGQAADGGAD